MPITPAFWDSPDPRMHFDNPNLFWDIGLVEGATMPEPIQISLDLRGLSEPNYIANLTTIHTNMAKPENAALVTGSPFTAVQLAGFLDAFALKVQAGKDHVQAGKTITQQKREAKAFSDDAFTKTARYFESKNGITPADVQTLGFNLKSDPVPVQIVAPSGFSATFGDVSGGISLHWNPLAGTAAFVVQFRLANQNGAWQSSAPVTASNMQLTGLTPGELYELRVCGIFSGQSSPGPACDTIEHRAA